MKEGADRAGRPVPRLIAHAPVCVRDDPEEAPAAIRRQFGNFARSPFYQQMFIAAGYPETLEGEWSDAMVEAVALYGDESTVSEKVQGLLDIGATEVMASPVPAGDNPTASLDRTLWLVAQAGKSLAG